MKKINFALNSVFYQTACCLSLFPCLKRMGITFHILATKLPIFSVRRTIHSLMSGKSLGVFIGEGEYGHTGYHRFRKWSSNDYGSGYRPEVAGNSPMGDRRTVSGYGK
jgi:hypothetical protein